MSPLYMSYTGRAYRLTSVSDDTITVEYITHRDRAVVDTLPISYLKDSTALGCIETTSSSGVTMYVMDNGRGFLHNDNGPAMIDGDRCRWYLFNTRVTSNQEYQQLTGKSDDDMVVLILRYGPIL